MPGSTRTIALSPPSVTHAAPSGPTMTPCGAEPSPSGISVVCPVFGSSRPSLPVCWAVYQTVPSGAAATSCGCVPAGTGYSWTRRPAPRRRGPQRPPLARQHAADDPEAARPERPEDDRLALLERLPRRLLDDDVVRDEHRQLPGRGLRAEQPPRVPDLRAPGGVVLGGDRVEERRVDGRAPEREPCGLAACGRDAREDLADGRPRRRTPRPIARASARPWAERFRCVEQSATTTGSWSGFEKSVAACRKTRTRPPARSWRVRSWSGAAAAPAASVSASAATAIPTSEREAGTVLLLRRRPEPWTVARQDGCSRASSTNRRPR